jgi:hypothetical protein
MMNDHHFDDLLRDLLLRRRVVAAFRHQSAQMSPEAGRAVASLVAEVADGQSPAPRWLRRDVITVARIAVHNRCPHPKQCCSFGAGAAAAGLRRSRVTGLFDARPEHLPGRLASLASACADAGAGWCYQRLFADWQRLRCDQTRSDSGVTISTATRQAWLDDFDSALVAGGK